MLNQWRQGKVGDFFELQRGYDITSREVTEGDVPVYSSSGISYYHNEKRAEGPGVVIGRKGSVGSVHYVEGPYWPHDTTLWVRDFKGNNPDYIFYFLNSLELVRFDEASSVPTLNRNNVHKRPCAFPPLPEQRKIAEILRTWDEAIDACERLIEGLEKRQIALVSQLVFGARRLGNFERTPEKLKHHWFTLPADWTAEPIGSLSIEISEVNANGNANEVLSCSKYDGFVRSLEYFKKQVFSSDLSGYKKIYRGDFGFPSNHVEEGSIGLQGLVDVGLVSPIYTIFRFDPARVDNDFAYSVLKTELYRHIFQVSTSASVDRRGSLRWSEFSKIPFPLPSLTEQKAINSVLADSRSEVIAARKQRAAFTNQKRGLMQKLLTGEWRVAV